MKTICTTQFAPEQATVLQAGSLRDSRLGSLRYGELAGVEKRHFSEGFRGFSHRLLRGVVFCNNPACKTWFSLLKAKIETVIFPFQNVRHPLVRALFTFETLNRRVDSCSV
jgi:hypothetical protein